MGHVDGRIAFVTGAAQGQGRSHAVRLAEEGADIIAVDLCAPVHPSVVYPSPGPEDLDETKRMVEKTGRRCFTAVADVRRLDQLRAAAERGVGMLGGIDIVVANAGIITFHESSLQITENQYDAVVDTNQRGVWNTIQVTAPYLIEQKRGGAIIITSSAAGLRGLVGYAHYVASKHAVVGLMRAFSNELSIHRIRVNTIHPTGVSSPGMGASAKLEGGLLHARHPLSPGNGTNTLPDLDNDPEAPYAPVPMLRESEISNAVLWLASDEARYVTGQTLAVDAGNTTKP